MTIKQILLAVAVALSAPQAGADPNPAHVMKTNGCGCCLAWTKHLEQNGFAVSGENMFGGALVRYKLERGVPQKMISCHTAEIDRYVIEGHVPAAEIKQLLEERPDAVGLTVPGMPLGSPGMAFGDTQEAYDVFLIKKDGGTEIFASYRHPDNRSASIERVADGSPRMPAREN